MVKQGGRVPAGFRHDIAAVHNVIGTDVQTGKVISLNKPQYHASGHQTGLDRQIQLLRSADTIFQQVKYLGVQQNLYAVDDVARYIFFQTNWGFAACPQQGENRFHGLLRSLLPFGHFDQRQDLRGGKPVSGGEIGFSAFWHQLKRV